MIVFDPVKDAANIAKHGVSLGRADQMDLGEALIEQARSGDDGRSAMDRLRTSSGSTLHSGVHETEHASPGDQSAQGEPARAEALPNSDSEHGLVELEGDDAPELTAERAARLRPAREVFPEAFLAQFKRSPGRPPAASPKKQITLRLDADVLEHWKAKGPGWQSAINAALRRESGL